jgi:hypothetical protein
MAETKLRSLLATDDSNTNENTSPEISNRPEWIDGNDTSGSMTSYACSQAHYLAKDTLPRLAVTDGICKLLGSGEYPNDAVVPCQFVPQDVNECSRGGDALLAFGANVSLNRR